MQSKEEKLIKNTIIYSISNFGSKLLTFLIVPLYTYYLTTAEFGTYDTIISIQNLLAPVCALAIQEGLLRWLLASNEKHGDILGTGLGLYGICIAITDIVMLSVFHFIEWEYSNLFMLMLTTYTLETVLKFIVRGERKNNVFAVAGVLYTFVMLMFNVLFVVQFRLGVRGMLWSLVIANITCIIYMLFSMRKCVKIAELSFNKKLSHAMIIYSVMLVPNNISWWIMNASDRVMLTALCGAATTGIYSLACKFPSIVTILHTLFYQAWQEQAILEYESDARDSYYTKVFNNYMKLSCCAVLVLIPLSKLIIILFMNESYLSAYKYLGVLYLGSLFSSFSGFYGTGYISAKDTKNAMMTTIVGASLNILINVLFIKQFGIWAACFSTLIGYVAVWLIRIRQTKKYFKIDLDWKTFGFTMVLNVAFSVAICKLNFYGTVILFLAAAIIAVIVNRGIFVSIIKSIHNRIQRN